MTVERWSELTSHEQRGVHGYEQSTVFGPGRIPHHASDTGLLAAMTRAAIEPPDADSYQRLLRALRAFTADGARQFRAWRQERGWPLPPATIDQADAMLAKAAELAADFGEVA